MNNEHICYCAAFKALGETIEQTDRSLPTARIMKEYNEKEIRKLREIVREAQILMLGFEPAEDNAINMIDELQDLLALEEED